MNDHLLTPLGWVENAAATVAEVPSEGLPSVVVLEQRFEPSLRGVEVGDHLYVLAVFDRTPGDQLTGSTATQHEQGAFSIRSSDRPNRIGLTLSQVTAIEGTRISFSWLDLANGTPVIDLKRYNWRWECVLSARRLDRRFIERQIPHAALVEVLARPAINLHGERCRAVDAAAQLAAILVQEQDVWLGDPKLQVDVRGDGHLVEALQGITGATIGNRRLRISPRESGPFVVVLHGTHHLECRAEGDRWIIK